MNQEKLAKLQAQVRIGGKVKWTFLLLGVLSLRSGSHHTSYSISGANYLTTALYFSKVSVFWLVRAQLVGRRRSSTERRQQTTKNFKAR